MDGPVRTFTVLVAYTVSFTSLKVICGSVGSVVTGGSVGFGSVGVVGCDGSVVGDSVTGGSDGFVSSGVVGCTSSGIDSLGVVVSGVDSTGGIDSTVVGDVVVGVIVSICDGVSVPVVGGAALGCMAHDIKKAMHSTRDRINEMCFIKCAFLEHF